MSGFEHLLALVSFVVALSMTTILRFVAMPLKHGLRARTIAGPGMAVIFIRARAIQIMTPALLLAFAFANIYFASATLVGAR